MPLIIIIIIADMCVQCWRRSLKMDEFERDNVVDDVIYLYSVVSLPGHQLAYSVVVFLR